ncbi:hypothetical protein AKJ09_11371 [Labilithrix luteola]|uniref:DUF4350 domain-containing protein n=1 Tax=Labilithrix luteola TaxID=1391654 RepID=A0A0K1QG73_9BACT|nr:DUF4350 domain-containing protein [Labilithrix luteola]AKV04708.1 hypothetical protein AKJ09_11371 [Labilithrix luteola]
MRRIRRAALHGAFVTMALLQASIASAEPERTNPRADVAREASRTAMHEGAYRFCSAPTTPLGEDQKALCPLAKDLEGCEALVRACEEPPVVEDNDKYRALLDALASLAKALAWVLVVAIVIVVAIPVVRGLLQAKRDKVVRDVNARARNVATPAEEPARVEGVSDAEEALREADARARSGDLGKALSLYLAASLSALDRSGRLRLARHRTNGEYVRSLEDPASRTALAEIVREVDKVEFGKLAPNQDDVARIASRATSLVRGVVLTALVLVLAGCGQLTKRPNDSDPADDSLPMDVLKRTGYDVGYLTTSLATLPIEEKASPSIVPSILIVDTERVPLEDETEAHLMRWVEAGGELVLFGSPLSWPKELGAAPKTMTEDGTHEIVVHAAGGDVRARVAHRESFAWEKADTFARLGDAPYAATLEVGRGLVLGVAGSDLFSNVSAARPDNAAALVAMLDEVADASEEVHPKVYVARRQDGVSPPSNPFSALAQAGLTRGAFHALAASLVLFLAVGIRRARPRPARPAQRRTFREHVEATGAFYGRARAQTHALAAYGRFVETRLRERIPQGTDPVAFLAQRAGVSRAEAARVYERAVAAKTTDSPLGDELETVERLRALFVKAMESS